MSKRALRRHHRERLRSRCFRILNFWFSHLSQEDVRRWSLKRGDTFTVCSCWMCGNPRRMGGGNGTTLTRQEIRSLQEVEESLGRYRPAWVRAALGPSEECQRRPMPQQPKV
jgi:hypothetical protein